MAPSRSRLDHLLLGSAPGSNGSWAQRNGRTYDVRTDDFGDSDYSVSVNIDRVGPGTVGWIVHFDGSFGKIAGVIVFYGQGDDQPGDRYEQGRLWPLPSEYWIDGARLQLLGWEGAPFHDGPRRFRNGQTVKPGNVALLLRHIALPVREWMDAEVRAARLDEN